MNLGDTSLTMAGARINVPAQVKPLIDKTVADQINLVQARMRNDPAFENNAKVQWAKACRSIPLQGTGASSSLPALWLELRPTRAIAAQPRVDAQALILTLGIEAETRITPVETKPSCPFPATISIVPPTPGRVAIGVPVDMPFTEINKIVEAQFAGKTFPEDGSGSVDVTVKRATVAASGNRLLISLLVNAKEKKSFFGFGGEANVHIWGKPVLDQAQQTLRLTDIELAVESEAAFGLLGAAARAAMPHLQKALADKATVDLKPFASNAQKKIAAVIADFQKNEDGIRVAAEITKLQIGRHRLRFKNAARDRGSRRRHQCVCDHAAGIVSAGMRQDYCATLMVRKRLAPSRTMRAPMPPSFETRRRRRSSVSAKRSSGMRTEGGEARNGGHGACAPLPTLRCFHQPSNLNETFTLAR